MDRGYRNSDCLCVLEFNEQFLRCAEILEGPKTHIHTYIHTYTHMHIYMHAPTHIQMCTYAHRHTHSYALLNAHTRTKHTIWIYCLILKPWIQSILCPFKYTLNFLLNQLLLPLFSLT